MASFRQTRIVLWLSWLALMTSPSVATAQTDDESEARRLFEHGMESVQAGSYADAVVSFQRSLSLVPRISTAMNLALALRSTGDALAAKDVLEQLLAGEYGPVAAQVRAGARQELEAVSAEIGQLVIRVTGGVGIRIAVDGSPVGSLEEPGQVEVPINPGTRVITASAVDFEPARRQLEVEAGATLEIELELRPSADERPGTLIVESSDADAFVEIEGEGRAQHRIERSLAAGSYTVRVIGADGTEETQVDVPPGRQVRLTLDPPSLGFFERPVVWITLGVVAAGAIAGTAYVLSTRTEDPIVDPVWGNPTALRF